MARLTHSIDPKLDCLTINIRLSRRFRLRFWAGIQMLKLGAWILGANVKTDDGPGSGDDCNSCDIAKKASTASELLRRTNDAMEARVSRGSSGQRLPCGCIDVCTDQRPGHPSSDHSLDAWRDAHSFNEPQHWCGDPACAETPARSESVSASADLIKTIVNADELSISQPTAQRCGCGALLWFDTERRYGTCAVCAAMMAKALPRLTPLPVSQPNANTWYDAQRNLQITQSTGMVDAIHDTDRRWKAL